MENTDILEWQLEELTSSLDLLVNKMHDVIDDTQRATIEQLPSKVKALLVYRLDSACALLEVTKYQTQQLYINLKQNENEKS